MNKYTMIFVHNKRKKKILFDKDDVDLMAEKFPEKMKEEEGFIKIVLKVKEDGIFEIKKIPKVDIVDFVPYKEPVKKKRKATNRIAGY